MPSSTARESSLIGGFCFFSAPWPLFFGELWGRVFVKVTLAGDLGRLLDARGVLRFCVLFFFVFYLELLELTGN